MEALVNDVNWSSLEQVQERACLAYLVIMVYIELFHVHTKNKCSLPHFSGFSIYWTALYFCQFLAEPPKILNNLIYIFIFNENAINIVMGFPEQNFTLMREQYFLDLSGSFFVCYNILYQITEKIVSEFCVDSTYTDSQLYISSAAYPSSMTGDNSSCNCLVTAGRDARVNISIQAIDVLFTGVGYRPRKCEQKLLIKSDEEPEENFSLDCNDQKMYGYREVFSGRGNKWLLTLNSHHVSDRGRVWLAVKGEPPCSPCL